MDEMITKYLDKNYRMNIDDYYQGCVLDIHTRRNVTVSDLIIVIETIFSLSKDSAFRGVNEWWDAKEKIYIEYELRGIK